MIALGLRLLLGGLFIYAGVLKLPDPTGFATEITNYRFMPELAPFIAATVPTIEIVLGLVLIAAPVRWRRASALSLFGLIAAFTVAVGQVVARGINVSCGCFGGNSGPITLLTVGRDLLLLGAAAAILWLERAEP